MPAPHGLLATCEVNFRTMNAEKSDRPFQRRCDCRVRRHDAGRAPRSYQGFIAWLGVAEDHKALVQSMTALAARLDKAAAAHTAFAQGSAGPIDEASLNCVPKSKRPSRSVRNSRKDKAPWRPSTISKTFRMESARAFRPCFALTTSAPTGGSGALAPDKAARGADVTDRNQSVSSTGGPGESDGLIARSPRPRATPASEGHGWKSRPRVRHHRDRAKLVDGVTQIAGWLGL